MPTRVLPMGGPSAQATPRPLSLQSLERPHTAKFSRRAQPYKATSVFNDAPATAAELSPRPGKRCVAHAGNSGEFTPRGGKRITGVADQQMASARHREDNPRHYRRMSQRPAATSPMRLDTDVYDAPTSPSRSRVITGNGMLYEGGRRRDLGKQAMTLDADQPPKSYASMERYKHTENVQAPTGKNVINPETLPSHIPPPKQQRFGATPARRHQSLPGMMGQPYAQPAAPKYTPRAPFATD